MDAKNRTISSLQQDFFLSYYIFTKKNSCCRAVSAEGLVLFSLIFISASYATYFKKGLNIVAASVKHEFVNDHLP